MIETPQLYICFPVNSQFKIELEKISLAQKNLYIQNHSDYLQAIEIDGNNYLGKILDTPISLKELELKENHILSVLRQLVKHYTYDDNPLLIMTHNEPKR